MVATGQSITAEALQRLAATGTLFFVLDCSGRPDLVSKVREMDGVVCLFNDTPQREHWSVAPYLVRVDGAVVNRLIEQQAATDGLWVVGECGAAELTLHLRELLYADLPDGRKYLFRYYDPRVFSAFLPTCDEEQARELFGPVVVFVIAIPGSDGGHTFVEFRRSDFCSREEGLSR